jgi:hypothetical protein
MIEGEDLRNRPRPEELPPNRDARSDKGDAQDEGQDPSPMADSPVFRRSFHIHPGTRGVTETMKPPVSAFRPPFRELSGHPSL